MFCRRAPLEDWPINERNDDFERMRTFVCCSSRVIGSPTIVALSWLPYRVLWREMVRGCGAKMQRRSAPTARDITGGARWKEMNSLIGLR